jgi:hypothetical protein
MRTLAFLAALAFIAANAAPADACTIAPRPHYMYWSELPKTLEPDEVALEVVFVRHPSVQEILSKDPNADVVVTSCDSPYAYRVLRVLRGDYKGPSAINTSVHGGIADERYDGQSRVVVGKLLKSDPPYFQMRAFRPPDPYPDAPAVLQGPTFPVPEISLNVP